MSKGGSMKIYYRVSPFLSSHTNPLGSDKGVIIKTCFDSFKKAITNEKVIILADRIPEDWREWFHGYEIVNSPEGKLASLQNQFALSTNLPDDEKVAFVEDDYLWVPGAFDLINQALEELDLISPYDHPGHYLEERFKYEPKQMRLIGNQTWRQAPSNTHTFATSVKLMKENIDLILSIGISDHEMFVRLAKDKNIDMFVPVPSLATHCVSWLMAPNRIWI